jgi:cytochrome c biogenesis protein CcdA
MRLSRLFRHTLYGAFAVLFLTGVGWLLASGLKETPESETWQAISANLLMVHGGTAMLMLTLLGALVPVHVLRAWRAGKNRATGSAMAILNGILIVTAFGLYYVGSEAVRSWMSNIHLIAGCLLPIQLVLHIYLGRLRSATAQKAAGSARAPLNQVRTASS